MSLIIKGMEMPKSCHDCVQNHTFFSKLRCSELDGMKGFHAALPHEYDRHLDCPLVPLPEKHGDLIDRDAFRAENGLNAKCEHCPTNTYDCQRDIIYTKMDVCGCLDDAPVIVPAEGGGEDG